VPKFTKIISIKELQEMKLKLITMMKSILVTKKKLMKRIMMKKWMMKKRIMGMMTMMKIKMNKRIKIIIITIIMIHPKMKKISQVLIRKMNKKKRMKMNNRRRSSTIMI
jgi:hypothetical protein